MSELKLNRLTNTPIKADTRIKKAKKSDAAADNAAQQTAKAGDIFSGRRLDTLLLSERARAAAGAKATGQIIGSAPQRSSGESDEHWMRRLISFETANAWRANSRQWREESRNMGIAESIRYQGQKATEWITDLMGKEPAMFREWLSREAWHMEEGEMENAILPKGFTRDDMTRWMEKDVLEYL
ncbi:MAG: hypothetical protein IJC39_05815 [Firmicutes bacterium]|nr:hypothetical protein [Bacillota bacterium]